MFPGALFYPMNRRRQTSDSSPRYNSDNLMTRAACQKSLPFTSDDNGEKHGC